LTSVGTLTVSSAGRQWRRMSNDDALAALGVQTGEWGQQLRAQAGFGQP
jgi:hypothetical protein